MDAIQLYCFYFEKEAFVIYVWTHTGAYTQAWTRDTFILSGVG